MTNSHQKMITVCYLRQEPRNHWELYLSLYPLCKEVNSIKRQVTNVIFLYHSVFVPRLIHNAEVWSNLTKSWV